MARPTDPNATQIARLQKRYPGATTGEFGDSEALSQRLIGLIREGRKTATCAALRDYHADDEPLPVAGQFEIVLDHTGRPAMVLRTTAVQTTRYCDVDWSFAKDEGEDDDLDGWRAGHRAYFERTGGFDDRMMLLCQRFEMVEDLKPID